MLDKAGFTCIFHCKGHPVRVCRVQRQHLVGERVQQARDNDSRNQLWGEGEEGR